MEAICTMADVPRALFDADGALIIALSDGFARLGDGQLNYVKHAAPEATTLGPNRRIYWTEAGRIYEMDPTADGPTNDLTQLFAGSPQGQQQIACMPDGDIWVEGCATRRRLDGAFAAPGASSFCPK